METANPFATLRHDSRTLAREASAAPVASFKRGYRHVAQIGTSEKWLFNV